MVEVQFSISKDKLKQAVIQLRKRKHNLANKLHTEGLKGLPHDPEDLEDMMVCELLVETFETSAYTKVHFPIPREETDPHITPISAT